MSAPRFCGLINPGREIWARDLDASISSRSLEMLSLKSEVPLRRLEHSTFRRFSRISKSFLRPISVYHRTRRGHGLQYCPACLGETAAFTRRWRWSFSTDCLRHGCQLYDRCPECLSPAVAHRGLARNIARCNQCGFPLSQANEVPSTQPPTQTQQDLETAMSKIELSSDHCPAAQEYVHAVHILITVLIGSGAIYRAAKILEEAGEIPRPIISFDLAGNRTRRNTFSLVDRLLCGPPCEIASVWTQLGLTQRSFRKTARPGFLSRAIMLLPPGIARKRPRPPLRIYGARMKKLRSSTPFDYVRQRSLVLTCPKPVGPPPNLSRQSSAC